MILRLVYSLVARFVAEAINAIRHEQVYAYENRASDPKGEIDGEVDAPPVGRDWSEPPWTYEVEHDRANDQ